MTTAASDQLIPADSVIKFVRASIQHPQASKKPIELTNGTAAFFDNGMVVLRANGEVITTHLERCIIWHQED